MYTFENWRGVTKNQWEMRRNNAPGEKRAVGLLPCSSTPLWNRVEGGEAAHGLESNATAGQKEVGVDCVTRRWNCTRLYQELRKSFALPGEEMDLRQLEFSTSNFRDSYIMEGTW